MGDIIYFYLCIFIVAARQTGAKSTFSPVRYPDYSTFPPTYSLNPPNGSLTALPVLSASTSAPVLPLPNLKWTTTLPDQPAAQSLPWRLTTYPSTPSLGSQSFEGAAYSQYPRVRYSILSSTINGPPSPPTALSQFRPFGTDSNGLQLSPGTIQSDSDWATMTTLFSNVTRMISDSVAASTQQTYKTDWKRWLTFTSTIGTDRYLQIVPPAFNRYVDQAQHAVQMSWAILACCGYMAYLVSHPTKPTSAQSASKYLAAVRYNLKTFGMNISFMDTSTFLKSARAGCIKVWQALPGNSVSERQTLPISIGTRPRLRNS